MNDFWTSIKKTLVTVAPILGNAILPGVGGIAGTLLASTLGISSTDPEAINLALMNATPEQLTRIKEVENAHIERLIELGTENDKLYIQDIQSARGREIAIAQATGKLDKNLYVLAWTVVVGFFILCLTLMFCPVPEGQGAVVLMLFGGLQAGFGTVIGYFFGSSKSSSLRNMRRDNEASKEARL